MNGKDVLNKFGFDIKEEPVSIYPYSPVYRVKHEERDVIVKRTQEHAERLMEYTSMLKRNVVKVVTPVKLDEENPQRIGEYNFVVYPYIEGTAYTGSDREIFEAGQLLGKIHSLSPDSNTYGLPEYDVYDFNQDEVEESMAAITKHIREAQLTFDLESLRDVLQEAVIVQGELQQTDLPHIATTYDYKANNLIMTPEPYLIDPDNATWAPRIFDLALALLLFHNEHHDAPDRVFTTQEWKTFLSGYQTYVELTEAEKRHWERAKRHIFLDEVMWLMAEYPEDWQNPAQQKLFLSLNQMILPNADYRLE